MNARKLLGLVVGLVLATPVTSIAAVDSTCGGITNGTYTRSRIWAHAVRNNPALSEYIDIEPVEWEDKDAVSGGCQGNYGDAEATTYQTVGANGGSVNPPFGPVTRWRPSQNGQFQVKAMLDDFPSPFDDNAKAIYIPVNAFEVKVRLNMIDNTGSGKATILLDRWEYQTVGELSTSWQGLSCKETYQNWAGVTINHTKTQSDSVHIKVDYLAVPANAVVDGVITANLRTYSSVELHTDVDDADLVDGDVDISFNVGVLSFGLSAPTECVESAGGAYWGFDTNGGWGTDQSPGGAGNHIEHASSGYEDIPEKSDSCAALCVPPNPPTSAIEHWHDNEQRSYDTGFVGLANDPGDSVECDWLGGVYVSTEGGASGARAEAELISWNVTVKIKNVTYLSAP